jgi:glycosyltransferase involved in cell wall biosynthesis
MTAWGLGAAPQAPSIDAVSDGPRPRWSVMIPTYDCAAFLEEALASVLAQDPGPDVMQIEVVDDASHDDPAAVVERLGPGRVAFFRQDANRGVTANLTTCIRRARGELVHVLHGDDAVRPGFYAAMERGFAEPSVGAVFCRHVFMDADGHWQSVSPLELGAPGLLSDAAPHLAAEQRIMTPSICVRRAVYERLGGFQPDLPCAEDWEMWVRIAAVYLVWYEPEPLALYRMHGRGNTGRFVRDATDVTYTARVIDRNASYLPPERAPGVVAAARATYALSALALAEKAYAADDLATARAQFVGAFQLSRAPRVLAGALGTVARAMTARARRLRGDA